MLNRPSPAMAVAMTALVVAIGGTAAADPIAQVAKAIKGTKIKKRSLPGNRIVANGLGGAEINESKLGKVRGAALADNATHAATADTATHATGADDSAKLGGLAPGAFVQGGGNHIAIRRTLPANTPKAKLFSLGDTGEISYGCTSGFAILQYVNSTAQQQDVSISFIVPNAPHATVDYSAQYGAGNGTIFELGAQQWHVHAGSDSGQATLDLTASWNGTGCVFDVQGLSTLALT